MNFELSPDQRDVAEAFARLFAGDATIERVRAAERRGFDPALWRALVDTGAISVAVEAQAGGGGGGWIELALIAEPAGRRLACAPLVEAAVAVALLAEQPDLADLVTAALAGELIVVFAPRPAEAGVAVLTPGGAVADAVVALDGEELVLLFAPPVPSALGADDLGFLAAADRRLRGTGRRVIATGQEARRSWQRARDRWRLATAALCAGIAAEAIDLAADYAKERRQFGVPIGTFQALQQPLADAVMAADGARLAAWEAAWRHDHGHESWSQAAAVAFAHAAETAVRAAELCLHVHGGYGYTLEYDAQLYLRRAKAIRLLAGDPDELWEEIGAAALAGHGPWGDEATGALVGEAGREEPRAREGR